MPRSTSLDEYFTLRTRPRSIKRSMPALATLTKMKGRLGADSGQSDTTKLEGKEFNDFRRMTRSSSSKSASATLASVSAREKYRKLSPGSGVPDAADAGDDESENYTPRTRSFKRSKSASTMHGSASAKKKYPDGDVKRRTCIDCEFGSYFERDMADHIEAFHDSLVRYFCLDCRFRTNSKPELVRHHSDVHADNDVMLNQIASISASSPVVRLTRVDRGLGGSMSNGKSTFDCPHCAHTAPTRVRLRTHVFQTHIYSCSHHVELVIAKALSMPESAVITEGFGITVRGSDIQRLKDLRWLNDEVINFYFALIQERSQASGGRLPKVYCFNTFFYPRLLEQGHAEVKRWTKGVDLIAFDLLLIPVHLGVHWCLAVVDFRSSSLIQTLASGEKPKSPSGEKSPTSASDGSITYFDSQGGTNICALKAIQKYLHDEHTDKKRDCSFDASRLSLITAEDIPQQLNESDCGVFACKFAEFLARDAPITFSQETIPFFRRTMVFEVAKRRLLVDWETENRL